MSSAISEIQAYYLGGHQDVMVQADALLGINVVAEARNRSMQLGHCP
ncbi:MAG: hypothetical protein KF752_18425 [Pirellulaceae bacterium]|nr:hypothetical protein [Pirellulaceae bacterium]